jgi:hypothetical protein
MIPTLIHFTFKDPENWNWRDEKADSIQIEIKTAGIAIIVRQNRL